ncbi:hypothetical protein DCMF_09705 [Candidatus Formimonas warabiya]|uniref:Uncharacterized protein n=1 Tax=Formimonas warabiya TaxID=1761012 RepID=A0A3G1L1I1_FORW1|nr:hypothetical protein DCMF_09705 [Candidatus Formimonas warabiya]
MEGYYDLIGYLVSSAKELVVDPKLYGPLRLVDAVSRLVTLLEKEEKADSFLLSLKEEIDAGKFLVMTDEAAFISFLEELVMKMARQP